MYSAHCDHSPVDGMVFVTYIAYMTSQLKSCGGNWKKYKHNMLISLSGLFIFIGTIFLNTLYFIFCYTFYVRCIKLNHGSVQKNVNTINLCLCANLGLSNRN